MKPTIYPEDPCFSSGPCAKRKGWSVDALNDAPAGRSHRSKIAKAKLKEAIDLTREVLQIPEEYRIGIVPASDSGAIEMAMWNMLGCRGVDMFAWESFGKDWTKDAEKQLKLQDLRIFIEDYGLLPDLSKADFSRDVVFTWNGTTAGVRVQNADWIDADREGITICDATSGVFGYDIDWSKLDITTWSWQKVMGGEAAHGILVLSPKAVERLESYQPDRPIPKVFQLTKNGKLIEGIFEGVTINTPSMLCVEDALDGLKWAKGNGGLSFLINKVNNNYEAIKKWVESSNWIGFLCEDEAIRSHTSVCLKITDEWYQGLDKEAQAKKAKEIVTLLEKENVAYDIGAYRDAPAGLRIWAGATVEADDLEKIFPWLDWAFEQIKK